MISARKPSPLGRVARRSRDGRGLRYIYETSSVTCGDTFPKGEGWIGRCNTVGADIIRPILSPAAMRDVVGAVPYGFYPALCVAANVSRAPR